MLVVIRELKNWRYLLKGTKFKFEVWTDHKNLEYFMKIQKLNRKQARQTLYLSRFNFTLKHILGTKIGKTDRLSRQTDWKVEVEKNNDNQIFIQDHWLCVVATTHWNGTCDILTSAKLSVGYLVVEITRELNKEPSLHCSSIYINTMWSILQQY